jgi:hypothetical protein
MGLIVDDRVVETSSTTGTGDITLAGAVTGYRTFSAVCSVNDNCYYVIEAIDASGKPTGDWECGYGTYSAANTLTRTIVQKSSNANTAVSFATGTKRVMICATAEYIHDITQVVPTATGPSGDIVSGGPPLKQYWRVYVSADNGGSNVTIAELQLREVVGVAQTPSGGTPLSSSNYSAGPSAAFDGNAATDWSANSGPPAWLGYNYGTGINKAIKEIAITNTASGFWTSQSPTSFQVQWSADGVTWTTQFSVTGVGWTGAGQTKVFTDPNANSASNTTHTYPTALAALNDVTPTPLTDGYALTYDLASSKWKPKPITLPNFTATVAGAVPAPGTSSGKFLRDDATWASPAGGGGGTTNYAPFDWTDYNPLSAHRYWRLLMTSGLTVAELYLLDTNATTLTGTWSTNNAGNGAASNVADGNGGTFWGASAYGTTGAPNWLELDLGAGNSAIVDQIQMTARTGFQSQTPTDFKLQYSDDNATWTDACAIAASINWGSGQRRIFRVRPYIVQFYMLPLTSGGSTTITYTELEILSGTTDLTAPVTTDALAGSAMGLSDGNDATNAFNNVADGGYTGNGGIPQWTEWRFPLNPGVINGVSITARGGFGNQAPGGVIIRYSRDGITYRSAYQSPDQPGWGSLEKRYFSLDEQVVFRWNHSRFFLATASNSPANAWGKVPLDWGDQQGTFDDQQMWDGTNKRFVPKKPGFYLVNARACTNTTGTIFAAIAKNGNRTSQIGAGGGGLSAAGGSAIVYCNGSTDYLELYCYTDTARALSTTSGSNAMDNYMEVIGPI